MISHGVQHLPECEDVRAHDEYGKQNLSEAEELPPEGTEQNLTSISKVMNMGVRCAELRDCIARIRRDDTEADN